MLCLPVCKYGDELIGSLLLPVFERSVQSDQVRREARCLVGAIYLGLALGVKNARNLLNDGADVLPFRPRHCRFGWRRLGESCAFPSGAAQQLLQYGSVG